MQGTTQAGKGNVTTAPVQSPIVSSKRQEWVRIQEKTFTRWVNHVLEPRGVSIPTEQGSLINAFQTGVNLVYLVEELTGKKSTRIDS